MEHIGFRLDRVQCSRVFSHIGCTLLSGNLVEENVQRPVTEGIRYTELTRAFREYMENDLIRKPV